MSDETEAGPDAPTLAEVEREQERASELRARLTALEQEEATLTAQLAQAIADGAPEADVGTLRAQRAEARALRADVASALPIMEARIQERRALALAEEGRRRLLKIVRAHGSKRADLERDVARVAKIASELVEACGRLNARHEGLMLLELEAEALVERFSLEKPTLPQVLPPARQEQATAPLDRIRRLALADRPMLTGRARRKAIAGTPGAQIIEQAGPTDEEQAEAARKAAEEAERQAREKAALAPIAGELEALRSLPSSAPIGSRL